MADHSAFGPAPALNPILAISIAVL